MASKKTKSPTTIVPQQQPDQDAVKQQLEQQLQQILPGVIPQDSAPVMHASVDMGEKSSKRLTDDEVLAIVKQLEERAKDFVRNKVMHRATKCMQYFFAQPDGDFAPTDQGRSDFVDTSVADTVRWLECPLVEAFCGTQKIVDFIARNSAQERSAEMINAMVNHVWQDNDGYEVMRTWINDALITPGGVVKIYWEPDSVTEATEYKGIDDLTYGVIALAAEAGECMIIDHTIYQNPQQQELTLLQHGMSLVGGNVSGTQGQPIAPQIQQQTQAGANPMQVAANTQIDPNLPQISPMLHDVKVVRMPDGKKGKVKIINVPLDEFYVDPTARRIKDARYAAHACRKTISELRVMGFDEDLLESIDDREDDPALTELYLARNRMDQANAFDYESNTQDSSMREVLVVEAYLKMDYDGDGIADWRKIIKAGNTILSNEPCDGNPFCVMVSVPIPHSLFGMSVAELAINVQKQNTNLMRSMIDNVSYGANAALWVKADSVDVAHVLNIGPGSVIPVTEDDAIGVVPNSSGDIASVTQLLEMFDTLKQERTGVQKLTRGSDADIVNETATGYLEMTDRSEQRTKLITRHFAETGVKPAALRIQALLAQYNDEFMQVRLNGQTVDADPMDARNRYDLDIQVGLGTGDKSRTLGALQQIMNLQMQAIQMNTGMADLNLVYNTAERIVSALGVANVGEFVHKPASPMPQTPPPQMSPDKQADVQIQQQKAQADSAEQERQAQLDAMRIQAQAANDNKQAEMAHQREMAKMELEHKQAMEQLYLKAAIQREQAALQAMVSPQEEQAMFDETFASTKQTMGDALTSINLQASGDYDKFLQTVIAAPEPNGPSAGNQQ
ncbi:portal protein [Paraburkholderia graminis]